MHLLGLGSVCGRAVPFECEDSAHFDKVAVKSWFGQ